MIEVKTIIEVRIATPPGESDLCIYPNPVPGRMTVQYSLYQDTPARISIYSASGREMLSFTGRELSRRGENALNVDMAKMPPGMYLMELLSGASRIVRRFVLAR
jgi:hypothetical protein